jgi:hypothetical protein
MEFAFAKRRISAICAASAGAHEIVSSARSTCVLPAIVARWVAHSGAVIAAVVVI